MKQFQVAKKAANREPVDQFQIPYEFGPDGEPTKVHTFDLYRPAESAILMAVNLAARMRPNASEEVQRAAIGATIDFLGACMDKDQYQTLYELLVDPNFGMELSELMELSKWAVETITARPTKRSTGSRRGQSTAGKNSTAGARSKASSR